MSELSAGRPEVETAVRARRATAAAYSTGFATLFLLISVGPYRRGEVWAWWAPLVGMLVVSVLILLRIPLLGTGWTGSVGGGTAVASLIQLLMVGVGLALGAAFAARASGRLSLNGVCGSTECVFKVLLPWARRPKAVAPERSPQILNVARIWWRHRAR